MIQGNTAIMLQFFGIGDLIFSMGVAEYLRKQGYKILWPLREEFVDGANKAYPNITFVPHNIFHPSIFSIKEDKTINGIRIIPIRWSDSILGMESKWWMKTKYMLYGLDYTTWKDFAKYKRDSEREKELYYDVYGLKEGEEFNLVNQMYRSDHTGKVQINPNNGLRNIEIKIVPGYSLFDYSLLIERATNIFVVNSAILYILELLTLSASEVHIYRRIPDEQDFKYTDYLMTKNYILH